MRYFGAALMWGLGVAGAVTCEATGHRGFAAVILFLTTLFTFMLVAHATSKPDA